MFKMKVQRRIFGFSREGATESIREKCIMRSFILWHVDSLLANDRKISNYTTAVANVMALQTTAITKQWLSSDRMGTQQTRMQQGHSNRGTVFSLR
jgi:hypothetical protein